jgi:Flp pilus assembly protein TadG
MSKRTPRSHQGQAIVLVALMIVTLTGMLALSVDVGNSFTQRRLMQTAADDAAMAGAHLGMEQIINGGAPDYTAQRNAAIKFANLNGIFSPPDTISIVWVNGSGTAFANNVSNLPIVPGGQVVQGMQVSMSGNRNTHLFKALGIQTVGVSVSAMAQYGTPDALVGSVPLLMNGDSTHPLYTPVLVTSDDGGASCCSSGQLDSLGKPIPAAFIGAASGANNFHILHDPPTSSTLVATRSSAANGLSGTLSIGPNYYIETGTATTDNFALGLDDRIQASIANPVFNGDQPAAGKFSPINPRVFMTAVNSSSSGSSPTTISQFLAFYLMFVVFNSGHSITIGGYWVNSSGVPGSSGLGVPTGSGPMVFRLTQ